MHRIITIGREFGSGGREFGRRLAEELGIEYYDKEIITEISKHTSLSEEYIKQVIECKPHHLYPITIGQSFAYNDNYAFQQVQSVYSSQCQIMREMAVKAPCVMIGRCADYILQEFKPSRIFVYADMESRIKRCIERSSEEEKVGGKEMKSLINNIDKSRAKYYEFYTGMKWGDKKNYDLCVNTTDVVIKEIVPVIAKLFR